MNRKQKCLSMWQWLAETGAENKVGYFYEHNIVLIPCCECYACSEAESRIKECGGLANMCEYCPVSWDNIGIQPNDDPTPCEESYYGAWLESHDNEALRKYFALMVIENIKRAWK